MGLMWWPLPARWSTFGAWLISGQVPDLHAPLWLQLQQLTAAN
jgi:hypothetical protein